jgi:DNA polymerase
VIDTKRRWLAKQNGLGAGYGMSGRKMRAYLESEGVDFAASGASPEGIIKGYRESHPSVVAGWKTLENAAFAALEGRDGAAGRVCFTTDGSSLVMHLPSGRRFVYRDASIEMQVPMWAAMYGVAASPQPTIAYTHPRSWRGTLYGGRLAENAVQALCRDVIADALVRCEAARMEPFLHVHDEIASPAPAEELAALMSQPPEWAEDFPLLVEAFDAERYWKKPPKGTKVHRYMRGRRVA